MPSPVDDRTCAGDIHVVVQSGIVASNEHCRSLLKGVCLMLISDCLEQDKGFSITKGFILLRATL